MPLSSLRVPGLLAALSMLLLPADGETVKDREGAVRGDKAAMEKNASWLYNEVDRGFEEARRTGKPLMVVLRCVPCLACMGIDAGVLNSVELAPLLDQFVRVRVINANDLDLSRLQFDFDLSFSTLFLNGDGTVYGRFGSWQHQRNPQEADLASFRSSMEAALALHRGYPANRASLVDKQSLPLPFKSPLEIPGLAGKYQRTLDWSGKVVQSCVHCHMIGDAIRTVHRTRDGAIPPTWIYPQPAPDTVGLRLAPDQVATVAEVLPGSPAQKAGFLKDDRITTLAGQPLVSIADVSWVLHRAPDQGTLRVGVQREG
ncbi:MAG: PDZ domain-containing protein, partial [Verrucomicrobiales bacterium]|nr:PDZ domain-containing protein [Verrucomicrobiales bacterium]